MKRMFLAAAVLALAAYLAAPAAAAEKSLGITGSLALNYWMADYDVSGTTYTGVTDVAFTESADQKYFPMFTALVTVSEPWSAILEYDSSGGKNLTIDNAATTSSMKTKRFLIGARYDFPAMAQGNPYVTLSHNEFKATESSAGGISDTTKIKGLRLGAGYAFKFEGTPWTANVDLGFGISNKAKNDDMSSKANALDYDLGVSYKFKGALGLKANLGYRALRYKVKGNTRVATELDPATAKSKGLYLGVGYDFQ